MQVKTKQPHGNPFGDKWAKEPGDEYSLPDEAAPALIDQGLVEPVASEPARRR